MPKNKAIKKVLVIGSGPIVIGQGAEFDYAGTQACLTLKEAGCEIILINNNPATIMTDDHMADVIYFEPLTIENIEKIIKKERPDSLLATVSGQTGLNLAIELKNKGILAKYNVKVLGTSVKSMIQGEDREQFRSLLEELNEPILESSIVSNLNEAVEFTERIGYPVIIRPAYTLGGSGGGIATNKKKLEQYILSGLRLSPIHQCLLEKSIAGYKEIEFEVIRDAYGTCMPICHMENVDPVGIHTGDSVVVIPSQTLSSDEISLLQEASLKVVGRLNIIGACNVQLAYHPTNKTYYFIEVNPRVSRSSALASKATGYPIAKIATKLGLGYYLHELQNPLAEGTLANYQPNFDYVAVKFPRWPFDKFKQAERKLGTQMKSTGEVLALEKTLGSAIQKGVRSLELGLDGLSHVDIESLPLEELWELVIHADDRRFFIIFELMRRGASISAICEQTKINLFFLKEMFKLIELENKAKQVTLNTVNKQILWTLKANGFADEWLAKVWNVKLLDLRAKRKELSIKPNYQSIGNFENNEGYYYSSWEKQAEQVAKKAKNKILIIGSGPIRIGQGVEFDYCSVHGVLALQQYGYEAILMNNNPATVSTDYEISDRLYFEPLTVEDVLHVIEHENIDQVIVQFGGQTAINLTKGLEEAGVSLLGSTLQMIDELEDRERFYQLMDKLNLAHIPGFVARNYEELIEKATEIGFPVLLRPSYVIGGQGMIVLHSLSELQAYYRETSLEFPILIDAYYQGTEIEVDVVSDGKSILIPAMFEHIEKAGVHSGDSMAVTPPYTLSDAERQKIIHFTEKIATNINFAGVLNIQYVIYHNKLYVLEVNPRASRTVPALSKVTGVNIIKLATGVLTGIALADLSSRLGMLPDNDFYTVKSPVFSTVKLPGLDPKLAPEMQSTGELISLASTMEESFTKAMLWNDVLDLNFKQQTKEIFIDTLDREIKQEIEKITDSSILSVSSEDLRARNISYSDWVKSEAAYGVISTLRVQTKREIALQNGLLVMSVPETVGVFTKVTNRTYDVSSIEQWSKISYEKEVVKQ